MRVRRGTPYPLGAIWDGRGANIAVFSEVADAVELCLFDDPASPAESERITLPGSTGGIWHGYFPDLRPGQLYGLRVSGPYRPAEGPRCNPNKVLFDPYAKAVGRDLRYDDALYGYPLGAADADLGFDARDSAAVAPLAAVIDPAFTWGSDASPRRALADTLIYEVHVKGFTRRHPGVPEPLRGTYAGLSSPAAVDHLTGLGVNAVELLPVQYRVSEPFLVSRGLSNYWGYNTLGFFAPDPRLAAAPDPHGVVREFKTMVATLHDAGIAVLLDVVYNHTAEGSQLGPPCRSGAWTTPPTTTSPTTAATPTTSPAPATRSTSAILVSCRWSPTACGTGSARCTSTVSGSTSPRRWPASSASTTSCPRSSTCCCRIPCSRTCT
jgi:glycogen operon protein